MLRTMSLTSGRKNSGAITRSRTSLRELRKMKKMHNPQHRTISMPPSVPLVPNVSPYTSCVSLTLSLRDNRLRCSAFCIFARQYITLLNVCPSIVKHPSGYIILNSGLHSPQLICPMLILGQVKPKQDAWVCFTAQSWHTC